MTPEERISFTSEGLKLEGALRKGDGALAALVLHPHPQYGGDMDNHVVTTVCAALADRGVATLRFNFRGAGRSEGSYDGGNGEAADARAAAEYLRAKSPDAQLLLVGYSFGAMIAAAIAPDMHPDALVLVSPPVGAATMPALDPARRTLLVTGELDSIAPPSALHELSSERCSVHIVAGVDHGWWPGVAVLADRVVEFVDECGLIG